MPVVAGLGKFAAELANAPVMGWERIRRKQTKKGTTEETRSSFQVRAWELAALGLVAVGGYSAWVWMQSKGAGTDRPFWTPAEGEVMPDYLKLFPLMGLLDFIVKRAGVRPGPVPGPGGR